MEGKENFPHNHVHNVLRLCDVLSKFLFTTSETMHDYYLETQYIRVATRVAKALKIQDLRKLGNNREVSKLHRMIAQCPVSPPKQKLCYYQKKTVKTQKLDFFLCALFHMKTSQSQMICELLSLECFFFILTDPDCFELNFFDIFGNLKVFRNALT